MKTAFIHLVHHILREGGSVSVYDGGAWAVKRSTNSREIIRAIRSVEEAQITAYDMRGERLGWALIIPLGVANDETVADYSCTPFMDKWDKVYEAACFGLERVQ